MIKDNKIYLQYKEYESLYGQTRRPAIVRYRKKDPTNSGQGSYSTDVICTLYIDGKTDADEIENLRVEKNSCSLVISPFEKNSCSLVIVSPFHSDDDGFEMYDLEARAFNEFSVDDWVCLFHDTSEFHRMGDKLSFANLAIALERFQINVPTIVEALSFFREDVRTRLLDFINYIAYGLSVQKIKQIAELNNALGNSTQLFFPIILEDAAKQFGIEYEHFSVHSLVDKLFEECENQDIDNPCGFVRVIQWLQDEEKNITLEELEAGFAYLGEDKRVAAIKRYFYDVKRGAFQYNKTSLKAFSSQNYQYYSTLRYIFEKWPGNRNVSTEFLLDCLNTYQETKQQEFQVTNGVLDWAIRKAELLGRQIDMKFYDWLCYCQGGIVLDKAFRGFAEFYIQYELDELMFEEDSLMANTTTILRRHCEQSYHTVAKLNYNEQTGEYFHYRDSKKPYYYENRVYENLWRGRKPEDIDFFRQFVNCSECVLIISPYMLEDSAYEVAGQEVAEAKRRALTQYCEQLSHEEKRLVLDESLGIIKRDPSSGEPIFKIVRVLENRWKLKDNNDIDNLVLTKNTKECEYMFFTEEMIKEPLKLENLEQFLLSHYKTLTPFISDRANAELVRMFAFPIKMKAFMNEDAQLGISLGVDEAEVKRRVKARLVELFGESLECDYEQSLYELAQSASQYGRDGDRDKCFGKKIKYYYRNQEIYCAPDLSDLPNTLTGRKCAICQGDMCFVTSIKKEPEWSEYTLIHILEIIGYNVLEDTEAGFIPNQVYNRFVNQINVAIRFYKRLVCKKCGHILFPAREHGYKRFKCLLPSCTEYNKEVYLNYCHECKKGLIDSRDTKQCPNGLYICPYCKSCCSNELFESMALRYKRQGRNPPAFISRSIGKGHKDFNMVFCPNCGTQMTEFVDSNSGKRELKCLACNPIDENGSFDNNAVSLDPWA